MIIGYARVSTDGQSLEAQQMALKAAGAERIFSEKISGAKADRKALASAIRALGPGDVLTIKPLDLISAVEPASPYFMGPVASVLSRSHHRRRMQAEIIQ